MKFIGQTGIAQYIIGPVPLLFKSHLRFFSPIKFLSIPATCRFYPFEADFERNIHENYCVTLTVYPGLE